MSYNKYPKEMKEAIVAGLIEGDEIYVVVNDAIIIGIADDGLLAPLSAGFGEGLILIFK